MSGFRLGCQSITFGPDQAKELDRVLASVASAGYSGVEIGFRHIRSTDPALLRDLLCRKKLELLATHVGGDLQDLQAAQNERHLFHEVVEYLAVTGTTRLIYSGLRNHEPAQFARDLDLLQRAARACRERGIQFLYHNHDWEFADGGMVIESIMKLADPAVGLCLDVGWVLKGGSDPIAFLERAQDSIHAIHFKDFATGPSQPQVCDTVLLGEGVVPLAQAAAWLKANKQNLWVVAEQDHAQVSAEAAVSANARFLQKLFGE